MAEKDITQKKLIGYNDVFADIVNVLLFNGKRLIDENDLTAVPTSSYYKSSGKLNEQDRDVAKMWNNSSIRVALIGIENQTEIEKDMPLRIMGYDGAAYRDQLTHKNKAVGADNYPVVTIVLYFGNRRWNKNLNLRDCLNIPESLSPFVSDYKINVFEIAYLTDEQVSMFKSDFKLVADYFVQTRKTGDYKPMPDNVTHIWEMLNLMSALTEDNRFESAVAEIDRKERINMCEVLDRIENRGIAKGIAKGRAEGLSQGLSQGRAEGISEGLSKGRNEGIKIGSNNTIIKLYGKLGDASQVADLLDLDEAEVEKVIAEN